MKLIQHNLNGIYHKNSWSLSFRSGYIMVCDSYVDVAIKVFHYFVCSRTNLFSLNLFYKIHWIMYVLFGVLCPTSIAVNLLEIYPSHNVCRFIVFPVPLLVHTQFWKHVSSNANECCFRLKFGIQSFKNPFFERIPSKPFHA